eukprot:654062-Rhodomonas_salina.2
MCMQVILDDRLVAGLARVEGVGWRFQGSQLLPTAVNEDDSEISVSVSIFRVRVSGPDFGVPGSGVRVIGR